MTREKGTICSHCNADYLLETLSRKNYLISFICMRFAEL